MRTEIDLEREFHAANGRVEICGLEYKAAEVLHSYDLDAYEMQIEQFGISKGYWKCPDTDVWYEGTDEELDFTGVGDADR